MINDPEINGIHKINEGIKLALRILLETNNLDQMVRPDKVLMNYTTLTYIRDDSKKIVTVEIINLFK